MTIQDIGLFQALSAKMGYLSQRQSIIAQNVANADTPGYRPKDLVEVDFSSMLKAQTGGTKTVAVATTNEGHLPNANSRINVNAKKQKDTYEVAPSGNAVIMEEQLMNAGQNNMDYNLMINIYQKQVGMMRMALGR
ncbi:MAG: flagellar basal body rod protein FlgB [Alphaproteobacteria bacterium]|nr:MAG: flagellar basal body rod protein FlgB [Alphaproteobacteria bacterium]